MESTTIGTRANEPARAEAARLCALYGGIQLVWGAVLAVSLQARVIALERHGAIVSYAVVAASGALVATVVQLAAGSLSDRHRARTGRRDGFYVAGITFAIPALAWFYAAPTFAQFGVAFVFLEAAMNVAGGPYQAVIPDYVEPWRRGRASAWMSAYQSLGNAAGLLVAGFVHDLRAVASLLAAALTTTYAITATHLRTLAMGSDGRTYTSDHLHAGTPPARRATFAALLLSRGLINVGFFTLLGFLLFFVRDALHVRGSVLEMQTALLFLTFTLSAVVGAVAGARPSDRYDKRLVVTSAVGLTALALAVLAATSSLDVAYGAAAFAGVGWGAFASADWALATALLPQRAMATAMGIWNVATTVPQVIAPLVAAPLVVRFERVHAGLGVRAAVVLALLEFVAGAALIWRLPRV